MTPSTIIHARYLCLKLRTLSPTLKIVVGIWGATENATEAARRLRESGADEVVTTLADAIVQLAKLAGNETPGAPAGQSGREADPGVVNAEVSSR